ncbi:uncharacterized protein [Rutidosis leptorrhynchoides]|uniref:uncharacterized protein n=1 Tax=Rutidosis leptorrhynchoides TaxID=125765 RepID=UPI003A993533
MEINGFTQRADESLYDAWVRFKKLLRACPPHGLTKKEYINTFYREDTGVSKEKGKEKVDSTEGTGNDESGKKKGDESSRITRPVTYPKSLKKDKLVAQYKKFQEMLKNVSVNLPITDVLKGMPNYGRFIKELISQRGKYHDETSFFIEEECNKILATRPRIPKKLGDPRNFIFPCKFGESELFNALADLGASINLMPHSLYERLGLGLLKPTRISIRLANHSFDTAIGIAEDILVDHFLATADNIILVRRNQLNNGVGEERVTINIQEAMKQPSNTDDDECYAFEHIDLYVHDELEKLLKVDTSKFNQTCDNEIVYLEAEFKELMNVIVDDFQSKDETIREESFESIPHEDRF